MNPVRSDGKPKRVCVVTSEFPSVGDNRRSGIATYAEMLSSALLGAGWEVTVLLFVEEGTPAVDPFLTALPVTLHRVVLPTDGRISALLPGVLEGLVLERALSRLDALARFDAIEGQNHEGFCWAVALRFGKRFRLRMHTSLRMHTMAKGRHWNAARRFAAWLDGFAARRSSALVTSTASHAEEMRTEYRLGGRPIDVLPLMTPEATQSPFRESPCWVGYLGGLVPRKGADLFVRAIPRIAEAIPNVRFVLIGKDPTGAIAAEAEALRLGCPELGDRIVVTGPIPDAELETWWGRLDLLIVPSRYESFGLSVIEAFSRAVPVLGTTAAALVEVAGAAAALVPATEDALAARAIELLSDPSERRRLAESGYQRFMLHYSSEAFREGLRRIYS